MNWSWRREDVQWYYYYSYLKYQVMDTSTSQLGGQLSTREERPRRAPSLWAVSPLKRLPTNPPKLGQDPTHDWASRVKFSDVLERYKVYFDQVEYRAKTNLIEGRAEAGHAKASPRVKYPKLAIKTRKNRRNLIFCCESANIWLSRGSVCLCALSPLCPPFYLLPVDKYG